MAGGKSERRETSHVALTAGEMGDSGATLGQWEFSGWVRNDPQSLSSPSPPTHKQKFRKFLWAEKGHELPQCPSKCHTLYKHIILFFTTFL